MSSVRVLASPAIKAAWLELAPQFEKASGHRLATEWAGIAEIRRRVAGGETADLVVGSSSSIDELIGKGKLIEKKDLARSGVGVAVRKGAPTPDITSVEALKRALRAAKSIGYSSGPSGVYLMELFKRLGIAEELAPKITQTPSGVMVGGLIAKGEVELGFQQKSELLPVEGIDYVGPLPAEIQVMTVFSAGFPENTKSLDAARSWVAWFTAPATAPVLKKHGLEPA